MVTAARAASRLTDPRMAQVFDVEDGGGQAYVVLEWVSGETLTDMLTDGPLDPGRACSLISEAARALAGAHAVGQAHLRLTPDALCWTRSSGIKITGLGIDAALAGDGLTGTDGHDPAIADTIALAGLLYAALTGYWPGEQPARLPAAPVSDGVVCTPRQVSADVSSAIDSVIVRALLQRTTRQGPPIQSPAAFADAIAGVAPPVPLPEPAPPAPAGYTERNYSDRGGYGGYPANPNDPDTWQTRGQQGGTAPYPGQSGQSGQYPPAGRGYQGPYQGSPRRGTSRVLLSVVVVLVLVAVAATVWAVGFRKSGSNSASGGTGARAKSSATSSHPATAAGTVLKPVNDSTFNIYGSPAGNTEDPTLAMDAIDGSSTTGWATSYYFGSPKFGGLKPGTGLLINMGQAGQAEPGQAAVRAGRHHGRDLPRQLRAVLGDVEQRAVVVQAGLAAGLRHRQPRVQRELGRRERHRPVRADLADQPAEDGQPARGGRFPGQGAADLPGPHLRRRDTRDRGLRGRLAAGGNGLPWPRTVAQAHQEPPASGPARAARRRPRGRPTPNCSGCTWPGTSTPSAPCSCATRTGCGRSPCASCATRTTPPTRSRRR